MVDAAVELVDYDVDWPRRFVAERSFLAEVLAPWSAGPIEHVGSTAIPGMAAKPVIDMMAAVESLDASRPALAALERVGYCYAPYRSDVMHWLCKPNPAVRTRHLHLVPFGSVLWHDRILFRDRLGADAALAAEYLALKRELAVRHAMDREAYTDGKGPFIERVLKEIRARPGL